MDDIWRGSEGQTYDALKHTLEENTAILGRPVAEQVEAQKLLDVNRALDEGEAVITKVCQATKTITIGRK